MVAPLEFWPLEMEGGTYTLFVRRGDATDVATACGIRLEALRMDEAHELAELLREIHARQVAAGEAIDAGVAH